MTTHGNPIPGYREPNPKASNAVNKKGVCTYRTSVVMFKAHGPKSGILSSSLLLSFLHGGKTQNKQNQN